MLEQYIQPNRIFIEEAVASWKDAVAKVGQPLIDEGVISPQYIQSIFDEYEKTGPYFVIAPGIAMPHSRPENGANENGLSLLVVKQGVDFGCDNDPVTLVVMLAAKNSDSHIAMLSRLAGFLSDEEATQKVVEATSIEAISKIIEGF